jgi:FkbM family methyltransferase
VEPFAENVTNLLRHIDMNRMSNVSVIQAAVADRDGVAGFKIGRSNTTGKIAGDRGLLMVPTFTIDGLVGSGVPVPDVVKIDIEGGELAALRGAAKLIARRATTWLIALDDRANAEKCKGLFSGYRIEEIGSADEIVAVPV